MRVNPDSHYFSLILKIKNMDSMVKRTQAVPEGLLSKEFLSQFKTEQDVSQFLKALHSQVLEQML